MDNKKKLLEINKSIRRASALAKEAIAAGDKYEADEISPLIEQVQELRDMLAARLEKEMARMVKTG
ncbi:MAG TPA: hypothetical protein ENJ95_18380 [Bacteroidetes bacterium]|nr:hypothetical protein [Bacteroidota bacterium]